MLRRARAVLIFGGTFDPPHVAHTSLPFEARARFGGQLARISVAEAEPVGRFQGWRPAMPVTQWSVAKPW